MESIFYRYTEERFEEKRREAHNQGSSALVFFCHWQKKAYQVWKRKTQNLKGLKRRSRRLPFYKTSTLVSKVKHKHDQDLRDWRRNQYTQHETRWRWRAERGQRGWQSVEGYKYYSGARMLTDRSVKQSSKRKNKAHVRFFGHFALLDGLHGRVSSKYMSGKRTILVTWWKTWQVHERSLCEATRFCPQLDRMAYRKRNSLGSFRRSGVSEKLWETHIRALSHLAY